MSAGRFWQSSNLGVSNSSRRRHYADVIHHSPTIDLKVLAMLAERKYLVDPADPTASLERLKAQVEAYRLEHVER
jgi:hypothetical protein